MRAPVGHADVLNQMDLHAALACSSDELRGVHATDHALICDSGGDPVYAVRALRAESRELVAQARKPSLDATARWSAQLSATASPADSHFPH